VKLAKARLKQIIKEEIKEATDFNERQAQAIRIRDGFVGFLESKEVFPSGGIPQSVLGVIENTALIIVDAARPATESDAMPDNPRM